MVVKLQSAFKFDFIESLQSRYIRVAVNPSADHGIFTGLAQLLQRNVIYYTLKCRIHGWFKILFSS